MPTVTGIDSGSLIAQTGTIISGIVIGGVVHVFVMARAEIV